MTFYERERDYITEEEAIQSYEETIAGSVLGQLGKNANSLGKGMFWELKEAAYSISEGIKAWTCD